jgi:ferredoxin
MLGCVEPGVQTATPHEVRFEPSGRLVRVETGTSLLEAARRAGLPVASACGADGICARCGMRILEGGDSLPSAEPREIQIAERNRIDSGLRLSCFVRVDRDLAVTATYW